MKKLTIVLCSLFVLVSLPSAAALSENGENALRDNVASLEGTISTLEGDLSSLDDRLADVENGNATLADVRALEDEIGGLRENVEGLRAELELFEAELDNRLSDFENETEAWLRSELAGMSADVENGLASVRGTVGGFENEMDDLEDYAGVAKSMAEGNQEDIKSLQGDKTDDAALYLGILAIIGLVGGAYYFFDRKFASQVKEEERPIEMEIWAMFDQLDHYYDMLRKTRAKKYRAKIEGIKEELRVYEEQWPEKFKEVAADRDVSNLKGEEEEDWKAELSEEEENGSLGFINDIKDRMGD